MESRSHVDQELFAAEEMSKLQRGLEELSSPASHELLVRIATQVADSLGAGGRVFFCGNGGSAADAQHLSAELVGRQNYDRAPAAGIALTVDTSILTAIGNDYSWEQVFARQVQALGRPGDVLFGISTSGRSANVVAALDAAKQLGLSTVSFTGREPRAMSGSDYVLSVPADETAKIQELQMVCGHIVLAVVERMLFPTCSVA